MKLCVNYLMELRELFDEGKINYVDYIKLFSIDADLSPFDWCISKRDVMFHGIVGKFSNIGDLDFMENRDFELQKDYFARGKTPYVSAHICREEDDPRSEEEVLQTIIDNVKQIKELFGMKVILENVPASRKRPKNHFMSNPEFITRVVEEADTGFLFDIGHARAAAEVLEIPFDEYVSRLPMHRLVEMHLAGCMLKLDGTISPNHSKMHEEDYEFVKMALEKYSTIETVTLEYGPFVEQPLQEPCVIVSGDRVDSVAKAEVLEQLERLHEIMENYKNR